jgi:dihydrofolate reductase
LSEIWLIAAVARHGAIGCGNALLFRDPVDQRHFRETTMGCPVIMGRRTWESLPARFRPLPGRRNLVLSRDPAFQAPGGETAASLDQALARIGEEVPRVFVIGGAELYAQALPRVTGLELTEVDRAWSADRFFPPFDRGEFTEIARVPRRAADGTPFAFVTYRRR